MTNPLETHRSCHPESSTIARALSVEAETRGVSLSVIPAQAGIQSFAPGFRVSRRSPGMTGCHEWPVRVEDFVSEQRNEGSQSEILPRFYGSE
jgi:hypothetical protein